MFVSNNSRASGSQSWFSSDRHCCILTAPSHGWNQFVLFTLYSLLRNRKTSFFKLSIVLPGDKSSAPDRLITDDIAVGMRHNQSYARYVNQALPFARYVDNG